MNSSWPSQQNLQKVVKEHTSRFIQNFIDLDYHSLLHTMTVVNWTYVLCKKEGINNSKQNLLMIAAWFHDTGFANKYVGHEEESSRLMNKFLSNHLKSDEIEFISDCILSTHMLHKPLNIYQSILRDADLSHLGAFDYRIWHQRLRNEWSKTLKKEFSDQEWIALNVEFLKCHIYHTDSAKAIFGEEKESNLKKLLEQQTVYA